jgi:hypothetical protein
MLCLLPVLAFLGRRTGRMAAIIVVMVPFRGYPIVYPISELLSAFCYFLSLIY